MAIFTITETYSSRAIREARAACEGGRHRAIASLAGKLAKAAWSAEEILAECLQVGEESGLSQERLRDIPRIVRDILRYEHNDQELSSTGRISIVDPNLEEIDQRVRENFEPTSYQERLRRISPVDPASITSRKALSTLFPDDPLLWFGITQYRGCASRWSKFKALDRQQFVGPNPLRDENATNGGKTARNTANVLEWRYAVAECDWKLDHPTWGPMLERWSREAGDCSTQQAQLANLWPLFESGRVAMVVDSGNKSLHFWIYVTDLNEQQKSEVCQRMMQLGCDAAIKKPAQFFRMPGGTRDNGAPQPVLYFNPPEQIKQQTIES